MPSCLRETNFCLYKKCCFVDAKHLLWESSMSDPGRPQPQMALTKRNTFACATFENDFRKPPKRGRQAARQAPGRPRLGSLSHHQMRHATARQSLAEIVTWLWLWLWLPTSSCQDKMESAIYISGNTPSLSGGDPLLPQPSDFSNFQTFKLSKVEASFKLSNFQSLKSASNN